MKNVTLQKHSSNFLRFLIFIEMFISVFPQAIDAQIKDTQFKHLTVDNGLSNSWVYSIIQDKYGFIWIGTDDGLNRYDGNTFRIYRNIHKNMYSISSNSIKCIFEDSKGNLWIGTGQGIDLYDRENERFLKNPKWPRIEIRTIIEDKNNTLWIGTAIDLYNLDLKNDSVSIYRSNDISHNTNLPTSGGINQIYIDRKENVWIGSSYGLHLYNKEKNSFISYSYDQKDPKSLSNNNVHSILEDKAGRLWIGTSTGLDLCANFEDHPQKASFVHYKNSVEDQNSISQGSVLSLLEDSKHNLWVGIENGGLDLLELATYKKGLDNFIHFTNNPNKSASINNNSIYSLFQDIQGNIWIGTYGNGVNIISAIRDKFIHIVSEPGRKNSLINKQVNTFLDEGDILWIGTEGGLDRYNKKDDTFKHYVHNPLNKRSIGSNSVWALCKDKHGNLWVGTWGGGLNRFNYTSETFEHYYNNPQDTTSIGSNNVYSFLEDSKGNLWICTMGGGLNMYERNKKIFIRYSTTNSNITGDYVQSITEAENGDLWLSNALSVERFDRETKKFEHFVHNDNDSNSLSSNKVVSVFNDSKGNVWACTDAGLNVYIKQINGFKHYRIEDGLPNNSINSILEDNKGNLWLGTNRGLSNFINAINIPANPIFKNYTYEDGLQSNGFVKRSCFKNSKGMLYFGGANGFNIFDPDKIIENTFIPPVVITDFQVFNKSIPLGEKGYEGAIGKAEDLVLSYTQSVFSFDFAALNYISPSKNQFAYKMEGFDKDWNYIGTKHSATYTNLDPGKYIFKVKGSNNDGVWNEDGVSLPVIITPPFWRTIWFYGLLISVIGVIAYQVYKWRLQVRSLVEKKSIEEAIAKERNLLRSLIDTVPDRIYVKDIEGRFVIYNTAVERKLGIEKPEQIIGKTDFDFYTRELAARYHNDDKIVMESGQPLFNREEPTVDSAGNQKWTLTTKIPLRNSQGQIIGLVGTGSDITERKQMEAAFTKERNLLRTLIDNIPDAIYVKDITFRKTIANLADVHNMHLQSEAEVLGKDDFALFPKELAEGFIADDRAVIQTGQPVINREEYVIDEQDQKRWLQTSKLPLRDEKGQIIGLVGIGRNITERKESEEALRKSESQLSEALKIANLCYWEFDYSKELYIFNDQFYNLFHTTAAKEGGYKMTPVQYIQRFIHPDDAPIATAKIQESIKSPDSKTPESLLEHRIIYADGGSGYMTVRVHVVRDKQGHAISVHGVNQDITERKLAEEALSQKTALLEAQLNSSIDGVMVVDNQGKKILQNRRTVELWKIPKEIADDPDDQMQVDHVMHLTKDPDQFVSQVKYLYSHLNESSRDEIELTDGTVLDRYSAPVIGSDGRSYGRIWSFRDITERKHTEKERERLITELQDALADVKLLSGLVPICASCKKIRDDQGYWTQIESYIQDRSDAKFSHSICPDCAAKIYPNYNIKKI